MRKRLAFPRVVLDRLRQVAAQGGALAVLGFVVRRLCRPLFSCDTLDFFVRDLSRLQVREVSARIPLEVREASKEELRGFEDFLFAARKRWEEIEARFDRGDRCFLGLSNGRLVHYCWLTLSRAWIAELRMNLCLSPGDAYLYDAITDAEARGNGVQPAVVSVMMRYEQTQGYSRHILYVKRGNSAAYQVLGKATETMPTLAGTIRCFRFAGLKGSLLTGLAGIECLSFELPEGARARHLGRRTQWVSDNAQSGKSR